MLIGFTLASYILVNFITERINTFATFSCVTYLPVI
jgi:hypothetical protein